ncbi:MAG: hypothetical protein H7Y33_17020 [Cytophagales bacterium]|nr:hypothetical protein [Rhizobacter sp.]
MTESAGDITPGQARARRASMLQVAEFLDSVSEQQDSVPPIEWTTFEAMPEWALRDERGLKRLALVAGSLYAAPALRLCLDARLLRGLSRLIGATALKEVLESSDLPDADPSMVTDGFVPSTFFARSAALLVAGVEDPRVRSAMAMMLGVSKRAALSPVRPLETARVMVQRAHAIAAGPAGAPGKPVQHAQGGAA